MMCLEIYSMMPDAYYNSTAIICQVVTKIVYNLIHFNKLKIAYTFFLIYLFLFTANKSAK